MKKLYFVLLIAILQSCSKEDRLSNNIDILHGYWATSQSGVSYYYFDGKGSYKQSPDINIIDNSRPDKYTFEDDILVFYKAGDPGFGWKLISNEDNVLKFQSTAIVAGLPPVMTLIKANK